MPDTNPIEHAPVLRLYGDHAARMARLCRLRPNMLGRIVFAPRPALHAIAAFLHLAPEAAGSDAVIAAHLDETDPRALLRQAIPDAPDRLYRAFERAGDAVGDRAFYEGVARVCRGPCRERLLAAPRLDPEVVAELTALLALDPAVARLGPEIVRSRGLADAVDVLVRVLRAYGVLSEQDLCLPPKSGPAALHRRLADAASRLRAPDPGFTPPPPFRIVRSVAELTEIGAVLKNCLQRKRLFETVHWLHLATGRSVYVASKTSPLLVAMVPAGRSMWVIEEYGSWHNTHIDSDIRHEFAAALQGCSQTVFWLHPSSAFHAVAHAQDKPEPESLEYLVDDD